MIHICHISTTFNLRSGCARRTSAILKGCIDQGYHVSLIVGRDHDVRDDDLPGVEIYCIPELVKYISPIRDIIAPLKIAALLRRLQPDLVHTHLAKAGIAGRLAASVLRVPKVVHTVHGPSFPAGIHAGKHFIFLFLERFLGRMTDHFVFVGQELREEYQLARVCDIENSTVIQTGRPDTVFERPAMQTTHILALRMQLCGERVAPSFLAVTVGRLVPSKQIEHSFRILASVRKQGCDMHLAVVGKCLLPEEREYEEKLKKLAHELSVCDFVHFTGFREDVLDVMEASDVVLLTSSYEGLPNVAVEAAIAGTPIYCYDVSGVKEILKHDSLGKIFPQGDIHQMSQALCQLFDAHRSSAGRNENKTKTLSTSFRESVMVAKKMEFYNKIFAN